MPWMFSKRKQKRNKRKDSIKSKAIDRVKNVDFRVYDQGNMTYEQYKLGSSAYCHRR